MTRKSNKKSKPTGGAWGSGSVPAPESGADAAAKPADIVGTWVRDQTDETPYPDEITFEPDGIYSGTKAPGSVSASKLDVGVFNQVDERSIRMSTATDRDETFGLDLSEDDLKLTDETGRQHAYKRLRPGMEKQP